MAGMEEMAKTAKLDLRERKVFLAPQGLQARKVATATMARTASMAKTEGKVREDLQAQSERRVRKDAVDQPVKMVPPARPVVTDARGCQVHRDAQERTARTARTVMTDPQDRWDALGNRDRWARSGVLVRWDHLDRPVHLARDWLVLPVVWDLLVHVDRKALRESDAKVRNLVCVAADVD